MPSAPRQNKKATKIAFKILGVPPNMKYEMNEKTKKGRASRRKINNMYIDSMSGLNY